VRVYVESFGCAQNRGEGSAIARDLAAQGHLLADGPDGSDAAVLVTCGVIGPTETRMLARWQRLAELTPRLLVTGCLVPLRTDLFGGPARDRTTFVPIREQARIPQLLGPSTGPAPAEPPRSRLVPGPLAEEVVIAQGCTSGCAYCYSRLARGRLESVPAATVADRLRAAVARGALELRLTGLDTAAWGADLPGAERLPDLVDRVAPELGVGCLRVGMMSPQSLAPFLERYAETLALEGVLRFVHLPVQSGSDAVLEAMHRGYRVAEFRRQVRLLRGRHPELHLATDVITGYPGETDDDARATEALLEEVGPETVNVTRFSPRPGTPAARLPPLGPRVARQRSRALATVRRRVARDRMERWIGERRPARVMEYGPGGSAVARLDNYLPVVLTERPPLGAKVEVRIDGARSTYLLGRATELPPRERL
jgi:threonylcarbamoyladenosine tRNA methylthiotransferase CDKAL1